MKKFAAALTGAALVASLGVLSGCITGTDNPSTPTQGGSDMEFVLDGDRTYIDNDALLPYLVGTWESADGRFALTYDDADNAVFSIDGSVVLETTVSYTHLEPGGICSEDLNPAEVELQASGEFAGAEIDILCFMAEDSGNYIIWEIALSDLNADTVRVELYKK